MKGFICGLIIGIMGLVPWINPKSIGSLYESAKDVGNTSYSASYVFFRKLMVPQAISDQSSAESAPIAKSAPVVREEIVIVRKVIVEEIQKAPKVKTVEEIARQEEPKATTRKSQVADNVRSVPKTTLSIIAE